MERKMSVPSALFRSLDDDGRSGEARTRMARGTAPNAVTDARGVPAAAPIAQGTAGDEPGEPARTITEAIERLIAAEEAADAIAEWMQGDG